MQAAFSPSFGCMEQTKILLYKTPLKLYAKHSKVNGLGLLTHAFELSWTSTL